MRFNSASTSAALTTCPSGKCLKSSLTPGRKNQSSGTWSIVIIGLPSMDFDWKCTGASMCVPLCVAICTFSMAQPSPSGRSCGRNPGKISHTCSAVSAFVRYSIFGRMNGGSSTVSLSSVAEMSTMRLGSFMMPCAFCCAVALAAGDRKLLAPMMRNIRPSAKPDAVEAAHIFEQLDQAFAAAGPADQPVMQAEGEKLWRAALALLIEHVERIAHVDEEIVGGGKAAVFIEPIVIRLIGIRNDEMRLFLDRQPIGQFIGERVAVVEKAAGLHQKPPRVGAGPARHPSDRPRSSQPGENVDSVADMLAFDVLGHHAIIDPAIAVADNFVALFDESPGQFGILFERAGDAEDAGLDAELAKHPEHPPGAAAAAVFEHGFDQRNAASAMRADPDVVEHALGLLVAVAQRRFTAAFDIEV